MTTPLDLSGLTPGLADPVRDSQAVFRRLMDATARPGQIADLSFAPLPPPGLSRAAAAILLTLADFETPVWLDPSLALTQAASWLRFHTGCPLTSRAADAAFALIADLSARPALSAFNQGDAKYPDRAATVLVELPSLEGGSALTLEGPGIRTTATLSPAGLDAGFWDERAGCVAHFQFGVDLFLCAGDHACALPRTTRIQTREG